MDAELVFRRAVSLGKSKIRKRRFGDYDNIVNHTLGRRYKASVVFPAWDKELGRYETCVCCKACRAFFDGKVSEMLAITSKSENSPEMPEFLAAVDLYTLEGLAFKFYTRKGILAHFETCVRAQEMWEAEVHRRLLENLTSQKCPDAF